MSERELGEISARLNGLEKALSTNTATLKLLMNQHRTLSEDVAVWKVTVPRNVAIGDQKDKSIVKYIAEIAKWVGVTVAILYGSHGVEDIFK